jgi:hypothetical protein
MILLLIIKVENSVTALQNENCFSALLHGTTDQREKKQCTDLSPFDPVIHLAKAAAQGGRRQNKKLFLRRLVAHHSRP